MPFYSNPLETHPTDEAISVANNKMFSVHQIADSRGVIIDPFSSSSSSSSSGSVALDAFGRQRVSNVYTIGEYKHLYAVDPNFLDHTNAGGEVTFVPSKACATLSTSTDPASYSIHQTKLYHKYQPGKSQLILSSFCFKEAVENVTKRTGYFDDRDGIYFEQQGDGTLNWVIRSSTSGLPAEVGTRIPQENWNVDKCDGTGPSEFNIDISKTQLIFIDFQWLGVGRVRCGFVHDGAMVVAHEYTHSNESDVVYLSNPNLPVRCEIKNTGVTAGGSFDQICAVVQSEGGFKESGIDWQISTPDMRNTPTQGGTHFPLLAIRLKNNFNGNENRISAKVTSIAVYVEDEPIIFELSKFSDASALTTTLNGGVLEWVDVNDDSGVEYCINATAYDETQDNTMFGGFASAGSSQNSRSETNVGSITESRKNFISQNYDSTSSEVYALCVRTVNRGNNVIARVSTSLQWRELY